MAPEGMRQLAEERRRLAESHGLLLEAVSAVLFRHDPIGINFEDNTDEYEAEAATILKRMGPATSPTEARRIVHEEFIRWFEPTAVQISAARLSRLLHPLKMTSASAS